MEIKRTGPPKPVTSSLDSSRVESSADGSKFKLNRSSAVDGPGVPVEATGLAKVRKQFSRADLQSESKVNEMVNRSVEEIIESWTEQLGPLSPSDRQTVAERLQNDPIMRGNIIKYLQKVLD